MLWLARWILLSWAQGEVPVVAYQVCLHELGAGLGLGTLRIHWPASCGHHCIPQLVRRKWGQEMAQLAVSGGALPCHTPTLVCMHTPIWQPEGLAPHRKNQVLRMARELRRVSHSTGFFPRSWPSLTLPVVKHDSLWFRLQ